MTTIKQAKTPTLIQHGEFDTRVPTPNAYELYQGLQDVGVPVKLIIYKGFNHGLNKPKAARAAMEHNFEWFNQYVWGDKASHGTEVRVEGQTVETCNVDLSLSTLALPTAGLVLPASHACQRPGAAHQAPASSRCAGGTVVTVTKGTIQNGTVVLRDGKIAAVGGPDTDDPGRRGGRRRDRQVHFARHHRRALAHRERLDQRGGHDGQLDDRHGGRARPDRHQHLPRPRRRPDVRQHPARQRQSRSAARTSVIKLRWGAKTRSDLVFEGAMPGIKFALGENPKDIGSASPPDRAAIRSTRARRRVRHSRRVHPRQGLPEGMAGLRKGEGHRAPTRSPPRRDLQLEPLVEIIEGKRLVHAHSYRADEILMMIAPRRGVGLQDRHASSTCSRATRSPRRSPRTAPAHPRSPTGGATRSRRTTRSRTTPRSWCTKGVLVSINSDSAEHARRLNTEAAKSMRWGGLTEDEALALVTINPAKQLRIDNRVGSLETGKDADVVVWTHHPLSSYAIVDRVYIDGTLVLRPQATEDQRLSELTKEKEALMAAERAQRRPTTSASQDDPSWQNAR